MLLVYAETGKPCIGYIESVWFILGFDITNSCSNSSCCIKGDQTDLSTKRERGELQTGFRSMLTPLEEKVKNMGKRCFWGWLGGSNVNGVEELLPYTFSGCIGTWNSSAGMEQRMMENICFHSSVLWMMMVVSSRTRSRAATLGFCTSEGIWLVLS